MIDALAYEPLARSVTGRMVKTQTLPACMESDDVLQEARLQILELAARHDGSGTPMQAWLVMSLPWAVWRSIRTADLTRRSKYIQVHSVDADTMREITPAPVRVADEVSARLDWQSISERLDPEYRNVLWWRYADGWTAAQIMHRLGLARSEYEALMKRAHRAAQAAADPNHRGNRDDAADLERMVDALRRGPSRRGSLPGRDWVCRELGISELRYRRLMDRLVADGLIVGRTARVAGRLAA